jgi:hypothetical protein
MTHNEQRCSRSPAVAVGALLHPPSLGLARLRTTTRTRTCTTTYARTCTATHTRSCTTTYTRTCTTRSTPAVVPALAIAAAAVAVALDADAELMYYNGRSICA